MDDITKTIALLGGGGLVAGCWSQVKSLLARASGLLVTRVELNGGDGFDLPCSMRALAWNSFRRSPSPFAHYSMGNWYRKSKGRVSMVACEELGEQSRLFWDGWRPIFLSDGGRCVCYLRGMFNADELVQRAMAAAEQLKTRDDGDRFSVQVFQGHGRQPPPPMQFSTSNPSVGPTGVSPSDRKPDNGLYASSYRPVSCELADIGLPREGKRGIDRLALSPAILEAIEEARRWANSGTWYRERQLAWRRGWLLYGPPGTGKSSLSLALAQTLGIPLCRFDIASMSNAEFSSFWKQAVRDTPCMILIEDIDAVFKGRENAIGEMGGGLSFDHLLNTISGVESTDGVFLIITTNDITAVDPALGVPGADTGISTRPGRLDRTLELAHPDAAGRRKIAQRILDQASPADIEAVVSAGASDSGAQFQERCSMAALKLFWETP